MRVSLPRPIHVVLLLGHRIAHLVIDIGQRACVNMYDTFSNTLVDFLPNIKKNRQYAAPFVYGTDNMQAGKKSVFSKRNQPMSLYLVTR